MEKGPRRTRSQAAPEWTVQESLILINEIHAIEAEYNHKLASFQKWQLVVENCTALDVSRSLNQCKCKWDSLFNDFKKIKVFESSYWAFDVQRRAKLGLPQGFSAEVFQAMDNRFGNGGGGFGEEEEGGGGSPCGNDTEPECEPADLLKINDDVFGTGLKRRGKRSAPQKRKIGKRLKPWGHVTGRKVNHEHHHLDQLIEPAKSQIDVKVKTAPDSIDNCLDENEEPPISRTAGKVKLEPTNVKVEEHSIASTLMENVKMINSILEGNLGEEDMDSKVATGIDYTRLQGGENHERAQLKKELQEIGCSTVFVLPVNRALTTMYEA